MFNMLDAHISLESLLWLFPLSFLLHDFEEIIFVEAWFKINKEKVAHRIPATFQKTFQDMSTTTAAQFSIPVFFQLVLYIIATYLAVEQHFYYMFVGFNLILFLHVFIHLGQSIFLRVYALGAGTALCITLPYSFYLFYRLLTENLISMIDLVYSLPFGLATIFVVFIGHHVAPKIVPKITA
ncbi:HXXEE domain-containing protein [Metabacillus litoralis]|uniref:HXXEE domain-containing protein n=1 Tax=Metabacillus litoralis TaxID=152268 RepID=A0A5C6W655_9BACI|nr:HXXEE domain-containing protein [Metabacillus litoralis]TXC92813.1 HXXEE domain-containing protein [Metabacillus litoralis]